MQLDVKKKKEEKTLSFNLGYFRLSDFVRRDVPSRTKIGKLPSLEGVAVRVAGERSVGEVRGPYRIMRIEEKERGG